MPLLFELLGRLLRESAEGFRADQLIPAVQLSHDPDAMELTVLELDDLGPGEPARQDQALDGHAFGVAADARPRDAEAAHGQDNIANDQVIAEVARNQEGHDQEHHDKRTHDYQLTGAARLGKHDRLAG